MVQDGDLFIFRQQKRPRCYSKPLILLVAMDGVEPPTLGYESHALLVLCNFFKIGEFYFHNN